MTSLGPDEKLPGRRGAIRTACRSRSCITSTCRCRISIMVDQHGERFCDESGAYMEIGQRMYARHEQTGQGSAELGRSSTAAIARTIRGARAQPGKTPQSWLDSGYMKKADTLAELARQCGIDAAGLERRSRAIQRLSAAPASIPSSTAAVARFDRAHGDPTVKPNPNLGAIEQGAVLRGARCTPATSARPAASSPTSTHACCATTAR